MNGMLEVNLYIVDGDFIVTYEPTSHPSRWGGRIWERLSDVNARGLRARLRNHAAVRAHALLNPESTVVGVLHDGTEVVTVGAADYN
jgi:hypothetical protein